MGVRDLVRWLYKASPNIVAAMIGAGAVLAVGYANHSRDINALKSQIEILTQEKNQITLEKNRLANEVARLSDEVRFAQDQKDKVQDALNNAHNQITDLLSRDKPNRFFKLYPGEAGENAPIRLPPTKVVSARLDFGLTQQTESSGLKISYLGHVGQLYELSMAGYTVMVAANKNYFFETVDNVSCDFGIKPSASSDESIIYTEICIRK